MFYHPTHNHVQKDTFMVEISLWLLCCYLAVTVIRAETHNTVSFGGLYLCYWRLGIRSTVWSQTFAVELSEIPFEQSFNQRDWQLIIYCYLATQICAAIRYF